MTRALIAALCLTALLCPAARANDFIVLDIDDTTNPLDPTLALADAAAIKPGEHGHKLVTVMSVHKTGTWEETALDVDCAASRWHVTANAIHYASGRNQTNGAAADWHPLRPGTAGADIRAAVCGWPDRKPDPRDLLRAADARTAIARGTAAMSAKALDAQMHTRK